jgi:hypothetical protein
MTVTCAVCGSPGEQDPPPEVKPWGAPDLDTRPAEPLRGTLLSWVMECRFCHYAAPDIGQAAPAGVAEIVAGEPYRGLKCKFERHSWLLAGLGHYADAGWLSLQAAWAADDRADGSAAALCRARALALWKEGKRRGQSFVESEEQEFALVADVLRRQGSMAEARETCLAALEGSAVSSVVEDLLRLQLSLVDRRDSSVHTMDELRRGPAGAERVTLS